MQLTLVRLLSVATRRDIEVVAPSPDAEVPDIACGPGTLALMVAPQVRKVDAIDFAVSMLSLLEKKRLALGLDNIETIAGDGTRLPFMSG